VTEHEARETPPWGKIDITVPHSARIWNYWLGGKDNYTVDRVARDAFRELYPDITAVARAVRAFLARAVRHLAAEADVRQFPRRRDRAADRRQHPRGRPADRA